MAYTNIDLPADYFNTVLYTGDDATNRSITGVGFQPDFTWIKSRSNAFFHELYDVVRGFSSTTNGRVLYSNANNAEGTPNTFNSFNTDGFTVSKQSGETGTNGTGATFVAWNWLANGAGVSNTDGTITSTVSSNPTAGFSVVTYTGNSTAAATVGHGLGVAPSMILNKCRAGANAAQVFFIYHKGLSADNMIAFNTNAQAGTASYSSGILSTSPTSTTFGFTAGSGGVINVNESSSTYVSYCFAEVKGYSKFGSYTGNGNANGTFIYTGFKPAWIMVKERGNVNSWRMLDNKRSPINVMNKPLFANLSNAEGSADHETDFVSNGFKIRSSDTNMNRSGGTFIYMAFAENPFVSSTGIPTTAR